MFVSAKTAVVMCVFKCIKIPTAAQARNRSQWTESDEVLKTVLRVTLLRCMHSLVHISDSLQEGREEKVSSLKVMFPAQGEYICLVLLLS